jgi:hypothetical protein
MLQENRENSVLVSLRELRTIEDTRVRSEEEQRLQARADERRRIEEERRRVEAERERREHEERQRLEELERQRREEALRLQEAEQRARIQAQAALEQQRLAQEMELRRHEISKKRPTWLLAVVGVLVVLGGGLGVWGYQTYQAGQQARDHARLASQQLEEQRQQLLALAAEIETLNQQIGDAETRLAKATTADEKAAAQKRLDNLNAEAARKRNRKRAVEDAGKPNGDKRTIEMSKACRNLPLGC